MMKLQTLKALLVASLTLLAPVAATTTALIHCSSSGLFPTMCFPVIGSQPAAAPPEPASQWLLAFALLMLSFGSRIRRLRSVPKG